VSGSLVDIAVAALRRLEGVEPVQAAARSAREAVERTGKGPPYTIAIAGDVRARASLFDFLAGEAPDRRETSRSVLALRRGPTTAYRARRGDGQVFERARDAPLKATLSGALYVDEAAILDEAVISVDDGWETTADPVAPPAPGMELLLEESPRWRSQHRAMRRSAAVGRCAADRCEDAHRHRREGRASDVLCPLRARDPRR
jgi:hypothetical protein